MKSKVVAKGIVGGLVFSLLSATAAMGAGSEGNVRMSRIAPASSVSQRQTQPRRTESFKTERTDSWLCNYVSPLFCSTVPTLPTSPSSPQAPSTPYRGRS